MDKTQSFKEFLATHTVHVPAIEFIVNILIVAGLSLILSYVYVHYGKSLSNRRRFSQNFLTIGMTTMLIITIVKTSLALSLGLVGALSIVRFRAAIKEPEELAYLFLSIAIGLGLGANQRLITFLGFCAIIIMIIIKTNSKNFEEHRNMVLTITLHDTKNIEISDINNVLEKYCSSVELKRYDKSIKLDEYIYFVEIDTINSLETSISKLHKLSDNVEIKFVDNKGVF